MMIYLWIRELVMISCLSMASLIDFFFKRVPWIFMQVMVTAGLILHLMEGDLSEITSWLGIIPGLICVIISTMTDDALGSGDSWFLFAMGFLLTVRETLSAGGISMLMAAFYGVIWFRLHPAPLDLAPDGKITPGGQSIPFIPFLMMAYVIVRAVELCGI